MEVVVAAAMEVVALDTNKFLLDNKVQEDTKSINNCCTKLRKFCFNKKTWAEVVAADMEVVVMEAVMEAVEFHHHMVHPQALMDPHRARMAHLDMDLHELLELNLDTLFKDIKSLNS